MLWPSRASILLASYPCPRTPACAPPSASIVLVRNFIGDGHLRNNEDDLQWLFEDTVQGNGNSIGGIAPLDTLSQSSRQEHLQYHSRCSREKLSMLSVLWVPSARALDAIGAMGALGESSRRLEYLFRTRSNDNLSVWFGETKVTPASY